jgi:hypothetical protein
VTKLARRALELLVAFFALYAFIFLPLGEKTGLEHLKAIVATKEAQHAGAELKTAGSQMLSELLDFKADPYRGDPVLPKLGAAPAASGD